MKSCLENSGYIPNLSVDCVIFGFDHENLNVLLLKIKGQADWSLPGGFIKYDEGVDGAAKRVLIERTKLKDIFLTQFHLFGSASRDNSSLLEKMNQNDLLTDDMFSFLNTRFLTTGYYALVKQQDADISADEFTSECAWFNVNELPGLIMDHREIINKALMFLQSGLNNQPVGLNLLPKKFTMTELQRLYEAILGKPLDRRNFSRKILRFGILKKLNERRTGVAHKSPQLYAFDLIPYTKALDEGLTQTW
ncbi:NUDIX hydrolase [Fulvivirga sedimenti]|uniref:NUDIX hydrolase n=1 Tax=Fulvivirga sedimenti TaxID=2879465 RepID=A0A9X1HP90_9BACT|nr:NUDIX hydrolase [Fulvivirga sedimenti]